MDSIEENVKAGYNPTGWQWRSSYNNNPFGPTRLVFATGLSLDLEVTYFSLAPKHNIHTSSGRGKFLWSIPQLYVDHCTKVGNSEESFWLMLIPEAKSRELFRNHSVVKNALEPFREEVRLRKLSELETMAWELASEGKATYFSFLDKKYNLVEAMKAKAAKQKDKEEPVFNPFDTASIDALASDKVN